MKAQSRRASAMETAINLVVGFAANWFVNWIVLPWYGYEAHAPILVTLGVIMTVVSIARQYTLRRVFEWMRIRKAPPAFLYIVEELAAERLRQINGEGYTLALDDRYTQGELERAAGVYCDAAAFPSAARIAACDKGHGHALVVPASDLRRRWPWAIEAFKPTDARRNMIKAGALLVAAIARHDRAESRQ
jgi:hypothetical protein